MLFSEIFRNNQNFSLYARMLAWNILEVKEYQLLFYSKAKLYSTLHGCFLLDFVFLWKYTPGKIWTLFISLKKRYSSDRSYSKINREHLHWNVDGICWIPALNKNFKIISCYFHSYLSFWVYIKFNISPIIFIWHQQTQSFPTNYNLKKWNIMFRNMHSQFYFVRI